MAITIDTTTAGEDSNSYVTLAECDAYFEAHVKFFSTWDALSEADRNAYIVAGALAIDRLSFFGRRYDIDQAMEFPRLSTIDEIWETQSDGTVIIPPKVKKAQYEAIRALVNNLGDDDTLDDRTAYQVSIGSGAVGVRFSEFAKPSTLAGGDMRTVRRLLLDYLKPTAVRVLG